MIDVKFLNEMPSKQINLANLLRFSKVKVYTDGVSRFVLFSIYNQFSQTIRGLTLRFIQYNKDHKLIKKEVIDIKDCNFASNDIEQIKDLIQIDLCTEYLEIEIVQIQYITYVYQDGGFANIREKSHKQASEHIKSYSNESSIMFKLFIFIIVAIAVMALITGLVYLINHNFGYEFLGEHKPDYYLLYPFKKLK